MTDKPGSLFSSLRRRLMRLIWGKRLKDEFYRGGGAGP